MLPKQTIERVKNKLRAITRRNRGRSLEVIIKEINNLIPGWVRYFRHAECKTTLEKLDEWLRRKVRCYRLKQLKRSWTIAKMLIQRGVAKHQAWKVAKSGKGWWRLSITPQLHQAMSNAWLKEQGLKSFTKEFVSL